MDIRILVATHKKYRMPKSDMYLPIHVGKSGKNDIGYIGDDTGDNISLKNNNYCELTALYWAWKNLEANYIGLCHYRRYFSIKNVLSRYQNKKDKFKLILEKDDVKNLLEDYDVIVSKKRNYYIETVYNHYKNAHYESDLLEVENIIKNKYPEFLESFEKVMNQKTLYLYNMFIMDKEKFGEYCEWLFSILFELELKVDTSSYDSYQIRVYGFISERLFNVWLLNRKFKIKEINVINMEKINWIKKYMEFIKRKIM